MSNPTTTNPTNNTQAVAVRQTGATALALPNSLALDTLDDLIKFGDLMWKSGLFPDVKSAGQAVVKILAGRELGVPPMEALAKIFVVEGKPSISADLMARIIKRDGETGGYDFRVLHLDNQKCEIQFLHHGKPLTPTSTYTWQDATTANLTNKNNWKNHPRNMLFARALTNGAKIHCPHLFGSISNVAGANTALDEEGELVISEASAPTVQQAATEAARNSAPLQVPRATAKTFEPVPGWPPGPEPTVIDAEAEADPTGEVSEEEAASGLVIPEPHLSRLLALKSTYFQDEEPAWSADPKRRAGPAKSAADQLRLHEYTEAQRRALYALLHLVGTGEALPLDRVEAECSGRCFVAVQALGTPALSELREAAAWLLSQGRG